MKKTILSFTSFVYFCSWYRPIAPSPGQVISSIPDVLDGKTPANTPLMRSEFEPGL
jgi:hypothetical protein